MLTPDSSAAPGRIQLRSFLSSFVCTLIVLVLPGAAQAPDADARRILDSPQFKQAAAFIRSDYDRFVRELIAITEVPAPPFKEQRRGKAVLEMLRQHGLGDVETDQEGNVMGVRKGTGGAPMLAIVAHLDTVFPEDTDVKVKREGTRLLAPGVSDDSRGIAVMLAAIRAMNAAKIQTPSDILFVGNVGEEGEGDLRGVKHLLQQGKYKDRIKQFLAIDGDAQSSITRGGVGSKRYRVTFKGPGGHSYGAFGLVNPAYAMASAIARFADLQVPASPKTTYSVGVVRGGTSVNSIPYEVSMDTDIRSESCQELNKVDGTFLKIVKGAVEEENRVRSTREGIVEANVKLIGERPCGETPRQAPIVQAAAAIVRGFGLTPTYEFSSTDSNFPMSLGIPAITIGRGAGGRAHSLDEWTDVEPKATAQSIEIVLGIIVAVADLKGSNVQ
jgi:acetylornithine deacetylase/succinyl-diaminopimelate desuccinylase-like protein